MTHPARFALLMVALLLLAACAPDAQVNAPTADPASFARRLATVELPPTPDDAQRRATQIAARPTATYRAPTLAVTPTVYVGVFAGVEADASALPVIDPAQFLGTLGAPTAVAPELAACTQPADPAFGAAWAEQPGLAEQLGCAVEPMTTAQGSAQAFERGLMIFVPPGDIWAIQPGAAYWHTAQPPADRPWEQPAPEGLRVPALGFGAFWKASSALREGLGYARADEAGSAIFTQPFERGTLLRDGSSGATYVLVGEPDAGLAYGPFQGR
jgi:hypothetical protein